MTDQQSITSDRIVTRRRFLAGLGVVGAAATVNGVIVEPRRVSITRHRIGSGRGDAFRVVQLTDLHLQEISGHERRIAHATNQAAPACIVITGDSIDDRTKTPVLRDFLALLGPAPFRFATLGNWEHWARVDLDELESVYRAAGYRLLINRSVDIEHSGRKVIITGLDDWTGGKPDLPRALEDVSPGPNHLVLAHSPVFRDTMHEAGHSDDRPDLSRFHFSYVLSGHTHGGQVALLGWAPVRPAGSGRYVSGWYRDEGMTPLYVSRGLGTSLAPVRFGAPPEVAIFDWSLDSA